MEMLEPTETIRKTRFSVIKLPKTQRFACDKKDIQTVFSNDELGWVSIGIIKSLDLNPRYSPRPNFAGPVVANLSVGHRSDSEPSLCLYPVRIDQYPQRAADEFKSKILSKMKEWLAREINKSETGVLGNAEYFVVEWTGNTHRCHQLRWR
jgi:hypothetical protein